MSSKTISAATGIAAAAKLKGEKRRVVAIIGDGGMSAGMAFEALNHLGHLGLDVIVVYNDNDMSISENVGALRDYSARLVRKLAEEQGKAVVVIEHDLAVLDFLAEQVHLLYGTEAAYGVVALPRPVRGAINTYLSGFMREENIRFRDAEIRFEAHPPRSGWQTDTLLEFPALRKRMGPVLEQFAYVASHDLQEPLRTVAGYLQLIERRYKSKLDKDADEFIQFAVEGAVRLQQLIDDLLTYSRIETRGRPFENTDCNQVLDSVLAGLRGFIRENQATITHDSLPTVWGDRTQIGQLFQNLIGNAIKFRMPAEPPRIHIGCRRAEGAWEFTVQDNGIGISPEYFDRIFVIFQRLHAKSEYPGTGIGLAICKKIVERHGGRIWVESRPGEGATFLFTIPEGKGAEHEL